MVMDMRHVERLKPIAPEILSVDATVLAQITERKNFYAGLDKHPAAMAMAGDRRAVVATNMRTTIAPRHGWELIEDNLLSGAYEWLVDDELIVRLSKTTPESRAEHVRALAGIQDTLFRTKPLAKAPREVLLIRLIGNPLDGEPTVDVAPVSPQGKVGVGIPLKAIAAASTDRIPNTKTPDKPSVTLPGVRRVAKSE